MGTRRALQAGFTIIEMMIATLIMVAVTGAVFTLMNPAQGTYQAQPEVSDMQQRMRVGADSLTKDVMMAGAGVYMGTTGGALFNYFAPIVPYRVGDTTPDAPGSFFSDKLSLIYVPPTPSQTTLNTAVLKTATDLKANTEPNCPPNKADALCGFSAGMRIMIFDQNGAWDPLTVTGVQTASTPPVLSFAGTLSAGYPVGANITEVATRTYYLKTDLATNTYQLMQFDGYKTDLPVVDNVVKLSFTYYGDPNPPQLLPNKALTDTTGPWTSYGPKPPALGVDNANDTWGAGENCAFQIVSGKQVPRLATLAGGTGQTQLTQAMLTDGPYCPDATAPRRFDADLLRVRKVRVDLRVQAALASLRGPAGILFTRAGTSSSSQRYVPDQEVRFDITPRNLNLGR